MTIFYRDIIETYLSDDHRNWLLRLVVTTLLDFSPSRVPHGPEEDVYILKTTVTVDDINKR